MRLAAKGFSAMLSIITVGVALSLTTPLAFAGDDGNSKNVTEDEIVRALAPPPKKPLTRGLSIAPQADPAPSATSATETKLIQSVRGRSTRSLSSTEREEIASVAKDKPNIDLEITFDYNSANISAKSLASVQALGRALTSPDLKGSTFVVAGHTDAAGGEGYNQDLSERRAGFDQALPRRQVQHLRDRSRHCRLRQEQAEGPGPADGGGQSSRPGRQHGKQDHRIEVRARRNPLKCQIL
ncbi:outer membrane protein OmpA-like peptidoglycan-associated protein [Bradyrhizobium sp. i1.4.4]